ncbi:MULTISPECIES: SDR family oxidoreductase [Spirulina sp. CCY15215]|uniref:NAD-dependent epimerase/dehydratase family protein n=1 Tax=Spirulina sp. CCY15215 TaxID=2767591 RepID=UPI00194FEFEF|nr:SDR family oxidoreductase [Spirulina major]
MKILITGALGYIGGKLVEFLRSQPDYELRLLLRRIPVELSDWVKDLEIWPGDITKPETLQGIGRGIDAAIHLASLNALSCQNNPTAALQTNVQGTFNLLEVLGKELQQFIYFSTFHVYGIDEKGIITEETAIAPTHPYSSTHGMAELYVGMYARQRKYGASIIRSANLLGAPLYWGTNCWTLVANDLCRQAIAQQCLVLRSSGLQVRNFIPLPDAIRAVDLLLHKNLQSVEIYNLGGTQSYSILEVAQMVRKVYFEVYDRKIPIHRPEPKPGEKKDDLDFRCDRLQTLGFAQQMSLEETIRQTLKFCEENSNFLK